MSVALHEQRGDKDERKTQQPELVVISESTQWQENLSDGAKTWVPLVTAMSRALAGSKEEAAPFIKAIEALIPRGRTYSSDVAEAAALIECMAAYPDEDVKIQAAPFIDAVIREGDSEQILATSKNLFSSPIAGTEVMKTIDALDHILSIDGVQKVFYGMTTHWYERRQGLHERFKEIAGRDPTI